VALASHLGEGEAERGVAQQAEQPVALGEKLHPPGRRASTRLAAHVHDRRRRVVDEAHAGKTRPPAPICVLPVGEESPAESAEAPEGLRPGDERRAGGRETLAARAELTVIGDRVAAVAHVAVLAQIGAGAVEERHHPLHRHRLAVDDGPDRPLRHRRGEVDAGEKAGDKAGVEADIDRAPPRGPTPPRLAAGLEPVHSRAEQALEDVGPTDRGRGDLAAEGPRITG
jgi:hypothetical protein